MRTETPPFRVRYADTDAQAVAYYGSYFTWFEVGLIHLLRSCGIHLPDLDQQGRVLVTVESFARYRRPAVYDDLLVVRSRVARAASKRAVIEHEIVRVEDGQTLAVGGETDVLVKAPDGGPADDDVTVLPMLEPILDAAEERVERVAPLSRRADGLLGPTPPGARTHTCDIQVRYAETDAQGLAYYGSYYSWFEAGRNELTRSLGLPYSELERRGIFLPVAEAYCRHFSSLRACETFRMTTAIPVLGNAKVTFTNHLTSPDGQRPRSGDSQAAPPLAAGYTLHACTGPDGRPHGLPPEIVERFGPSG